MFQEKNFSCPHMRLLSVCPLGLQMPDRLTNPVILLKVLGQLKLAQQMQSEAYACTCFSLKCFSREMTRRGDPRGEMKLQVWP